MDSRPFYDRRDAGRRLAEMLEPLRGNPGAVVLGLPRGGVPVAAEVAARLNLPLDVYLVRKLGVPGQEELAFGAIASGGVRVLNPDVVAELALREDTIDAVTAIENAELRRRQAAYRDDRPAPDLSGKTVILVDDGLATGATMKAAVQSARAQGPARVIVAVPVAAAPTCRDLQEIADEVVCAFTPEPFHAVGLWYEDFSETSDEEVRRLLRSAA